MHESSSLRQRKDTEECTAKSTSEQWQERSKKSLTCWDKYGKYILFLLFIEFTIITIVVIAVLLMDSPIQPKRILLPTPRPLENVLKPNTILQNGKRLFEGRIIGPESLALLDGKIYASTYDGKIVRIDDDDKTLTTIVKFGKEPCGTLADEHTCGRPLGLRVSEHGTLYVMDAYLGLFEVNITGSFTQLISSSQIYMGYQIRYGNDVAKLPGGKIFVTDSSTKWQRRDFPYSSFESAPSGRLIWFDPVSKYGEVALSGLYSPNGIQLSPNNDFLLICETSRYRILKYYISGDKLGQTEVFIDNLPMKPDNIRPSRDGGYWLAMVGPIRNGKISYVLIDLLASMPWIRMQLAKIFNPIFIMNMTPWYGLILELNKDGQIIKSLHDPTGVALNSASEVLDTGDALYIGSYIAPYLIKLDYKSTSNKKS